MKIAHLTAREILDSRGFPTLEAEVTLGDGTIALGQVPTGASVGSTEAIELRDGDSHRYRGQGVLKAVDTVKEIQALLVGMDVYNQKAIDNALIDADGTPNKSKLGANTLLAISMAVARAGARSKKIPLFAYFASLIGRTEYSLPEPLILVMEGGKHGDWSTDIQEYMVMPSKRYFLTFAQRLRVGVEVYHQLHQILEEKKYSTGVGLEGAFCPRELSSNEEALGLIVEAIEKAGFKPGEEVGLALDCASSEFYAEGVYQMRSEEQSLTGELWQERLSHWLRTYPIWSLEDPFFEEDWELWVGLNAEVNGKVQIVGDDLLTTHVERIEKAVELKAVSAVIIKPNQVGTITETLSAIDLCHKSSLTCIVSHRAGEPNDDLIADLAVGTGATQCKFGAPTRGERVAKYNRLLRIEEKTLG